MALILLTTVTNTELIGADGDTLLSAVYSDDAPPYSTTRTSAPSTRSERRAALPEIFRFGVLLYEMLSYAEAHQEYSHLLLMLGLVNESFTESKKFLELDPVSESPIGHLAWHYYAARQDDEAIQELQKALKLYPDAYEHFKFGDVLYQKGMFGEAVEEYLKGLAQDETPPDKIAQLREAFARSGIKGFYQKWIEQLKAGQQTETDHFTIAELYARLGEKDQAFEWLEKAYAEHNDGLVRLKEEVGFDNLRSDPRYADLLRRIGLPQ